MRWGINYWDVKDKRRRVRQRYDRTYSHKWKALAECAAFFCKWEVARVVRVRA